MANRTIQNIYSQLISSQASRHTQPVFFDDPPVKVLTMVQAHNPHMVVGDQATCAPGPANDACHAALPIIDGLTAGTSYRYRFSARGTTSVRRRSPCPGTTTISMS